MGVSGRVDDSVWQGKFHSAWGVCQGGVEWRVELTLGSASGTEKFGGVTESRGGVVGGEDNTAES